MKFGRFKNKRKHEANKGNKDIKENREDEQFTDKEVTTTAKNI